MKIPNAALRERIVVRDYQGEGALGPIFGDPRTIRASVQDLTRILISDIGEETTNSAMVLIRPEDGPIRVESWIEWNGEAYRVQKSFGMPDSHRPSHWEITLRRWAKSA